MRARDIIMSITALALGASCQTPQQYKLVVGTLTDGESQGIYIYDFDEESCEATPSTITPIENPTFMSYTDGGRRLYSVVENGAESSAVVSFDYDETTDELNELSRQYCESAYPCHIVKGDGWVATANYGGGNISTFGVGDDGVVGPMRQQIEFNNGDSSTPSHLHCLIPSPDGKMLFANDLGKDKIYRFELASRKDIDAGGDVLRPLGSPVSLAKGSGPRHLTFSPDGDRAYLMTELSGEVVGFDYKDGSLDPFQIIASDSVGGGGGADIHISADGRYLYASNRLKEDGISTFAIDPDNGHLTKIDYTNTGIHPRNFTLSPSGDLLLVACRDSDAVQIYKRDQDSGLLSYTGREFDIKLDSPMFVSFLVK